MACLVAVAILAAGTASHAAASPNAALLVTGHQVKVEGRSTADGSFDAEQIAVRDVDHTAKVEGRLSSVRADRTGFTILGFDIVIADDATIYHGTRPGASRAELAPGTWLEAKGTSRGRSLIAHRIRIKESPEPTEEIEGRIESVDTRTGAVTVLGRLIRIPSTVTVIDERQGEVIQHDTRMRRDVDDQSREPWRLGSRVLVGGRLDSSWTHTHNYDLAPGDDRADQWSSRVQLIGSAQVSASLEAYAKVSINGSALQQRAGLSSQRDAEVQEAYLMAHRVGGSPVSVQIGRQRFRDSREWFFDEYMDAARLTVSHGDWSADAAFSNGIFAGDVARRDRRDKRHWLATLTRQFNGTTRTSAFLVRRNDTGQADDDPWWLGGSIDAKQRSGSRVWMLSAMRRGHRGSTTLGGWAVDGGGTMVFPDLTGTPSLTVGYARASGDSVSGDGRDTTFRQTDLEDNSARLGGLRRISYYGELFDPELSNLQVWTLGGGLKPSRTVGVDLVLHRYRQSVRRSSLPSSAFDVDTRGRSTLLGHEVNGAVTFRLGRADVDLAAGAFIAGTALGGARRVAFFWRPYVRLYF